MKLEKLATNLHKVDFGGAKVVYFSYETPIAFYDAFQDALFIIAKYKSDGIKWSATTTRHVNMVMNLHTNVIRRTESSAELNANIIKNF